MTTIVTPSVTYTTFLVGDMGIPCEYSHNEWCGKAPAEWIVFVSCQGCGFSAPRLTGTDCKDLFMHTEHLIECPSCGAVGRPKDFLSRIEVL